MTKSSLSPRPSRSERAGIVRSVERALSILTVLGDDEEGYRLTDIARRADLSISTAHRLLTTLERQKFVQFDPSDGMWHVGPAAFTVGSAFVRQRNFVVPALSYLRRLRDLTRETANLGVADDGQVVVLAQVESRQIMRAITRVGGRVPMTASGMGKAILSTYSPADINAIITNRSAYRFTDNSSNRDADLRRHLIDTRKNGYAVDDEEFAVGLRCIASVVYNQQAEALCSISVSGLSQRLTKDRVPAIGRLLRDTAQEITMALGGRMPQ